MFYRLRYFIVFVLGALWFSLFQKWGAFPDPDAFYHAKMASLLMEQGPLHAFPWLDLTVLHPGFHNQHLLFHYFLVPFVWLFGMLVGAQIAAVVAGALFSVIAYVVLEKFAIRHAWFWACIFLTLPPVTARLSLAKASPFAIGLFLLGILCWKQASRFWLFLVTVIYALSHGGWIILPGALVVLSAGDWIYQRFVLDKRSRLDLVSPLISFGGGMFGTGFHPNFPEALHYLWVQIFQIGVVTPVGRVLMGTEWYPYPPLEIVSQAAMLFILFLYIILGCFFALRTTLDESHASRSIGLGFLLAIFFALTLKSARFVEYFAPVAVLWLASLAQQIDERRLFQFLRNQFRFLPHVLVVMGLIVIGRSAIKARQQLFVSAKPFTRFEKAMQVVSAQLKPGERLFHSDWAQFPLLWSKNDHVRYVAGLDPVFLLQASSTLSDAYTDLTLGNTTSGAYEIISERFASRIVFVERKPSQKLDAILRADDRFSLLYEDDEAILFSLKK